jgi:AraC-like DNA-binding protein
MASVHGFNVDAIEATFSSIDEWNWNPKDTAAPWWRLYWNERRGWSVRFRNRRHDLAPNRVVLIAPETGFVARSECAVRHFWVHFRVGPPIAALRGGVFELEADALLRAALEECLSAMAASDPIRTALRVPALCAFALSKLPRLPVSMQERSAKVMELLNAVATGQDPQLSSNGELARQVSMNPTAFGRWFKREFGTTPHAFVLSRRVAQACSLLRHTKLSVEEIGEQLGFCDRYHFTRTFTRLRGLSPSSFRNQAI